MIPQALGMKLQQSIYNYETYDDDDNQGIQGFFGCSYEPASNRNEVVGFDTEGNEFEDPERTVFSTSAMNLVCTRIFEVDAVLEETGPYISRLQFQVLRKLDFIDLRRQFNHDETDPESSSLHSFSNVTDNNMRWSSKS